MGAARRKYTQAFRDEAVELVTASGQPIAAIARELGINEGSLGNWMNKAKRAGAIKSRPLTADERSELEGLRTEVRRVRMERDLLKKAAAWFASQSM